MTVFAKKIDSIINSPEKKMTKREARQILRSYGVIDSNNKVTPAFEPIVKAKDESDK